MNSDFKLSKNNTATITAAARMLKAVAHPARISIINLLVQDSKLSVNEIQSKIGATQSMTSQHLAVLRNAGILASTKDANVCYYYILKKDVLKLLECVSRCAEQYSIGG